MGSKVYLALSNGESSPTLVLDWNERNICILLLTPGGRDLPQPAGKITLSPSFAYPLCCISFIRTGPYNGYHEGCRIISKEVLMIFFIHFVLAFFTALILTMIFVGGLRRGGPWASFLAFFIVTFLASWAGGLWMQPLGAALWGVYWLPFLLVGLIFALVIAAVSTPSKPERSTVKLVQEPEIEETRAKSALTAFGLFFYIVVIALAVAIMVRYI